MIFRAEKRLYFKTDDFIRVILCFWQTDQRPAARHREENQHDEGALQAGNWIETITSDRPQKHEARFQLQVRGKLRENAHGVVRRVDSTRQTSPAFFLVGRVPWVSTSLSQRNVHRILTPNVSVPYKQWLTAHAWKFLECRDSGICGAFFYISHGRPKKGLPESWCREWAKDGGVSCSYKARKRSAIRRTGPRFRGGAGPTPRRGTRVCLRSVARAARREQYESVALFSGCGAGSRP